MFYVLIVGVSIRHIQVQCFSFEIRNALAAWMPVHILIFPWGTGYLVAFVLM